MVLTGKIKKSNYSYGSLKRYHLKYIYKKKKLKGLLYVWWGGGAGKLNYPDYIFKSVCRLYTKNLRLFHHNANR